MILMDELHIGYEELLQLDHVERIEMMKELSVRRTEQRRQIEKNMSHARGRR